VEGDQKRDRPDWLQPTFHGEMPADHPIKEDPVGPKLRAEDDRLDLAGPEIAAGGKQFSNLPEASGVLGGDRTDPARQAHFLGSGATSAFAHHLPEDGGWNKKAPAQPFQELEPPDAGERDER
jgi:hypothetical protein